MKKLIDLFSQDNFDGYRDVVNDDSFFDYPLLVWYITDNKMTYDLIFKSLHVDITDREITDKDIAIRIMTEAMEEWESHKQVLEPAKEVILNKEDLKSQQKLIDLFPEDEFDSYFEKFEAPNVSADYDFLIKHIKGAGYDYQGLYDNIKCVREDGDDVCDEDIRVSVMWDLILNWDCEWEPPFWACKHLRKKSGEREKLLEILNVAYFYIDLEDHKEDLEIWFDLDRFKLIQYAEDNEVTFDSVVDSFIQEFNESPSFESDNPLLPDDVDEQEIIHHFIKQVAVEINPDYERPISEWMS